MSANCSVSETAGYLSCIDDNGTIIIDVPDTWLDFNGADWVYDGDSIGVAISASPDLAAFDYDKNTPGVFFGASDTFAQWGGYVQFLDVYTAWYKDACHFDGRYDYNDGLYKGKVDYYSRCDGTGGGGAYVLAAVPIANPTSAMIVITIQLPAGESTTVDAVDIGTLWALSRWHESAALATSSREISGGTKGFSRRPTSINTGWIPSFRMHSFT